MSLDVLTPKGQQSVRDEQIAAGIFLSQNPRYAYCQTPKQRGADVDAILLRNGVMDQVIETKCRYDCDMDKFMGQYRGQWLVTYDKIVRAMATAKSLQIGLTGFVYIVRSQILLVQRIVDAEGKFMVPFSVQTTQTQATTNGGLAVRANAYIDMRDATVIKGVFE
jgi:hypothetical protein